MNPLGRRRWAIPGGHIPFPSTGYEPTFTSRDVLRLLNAGNEAAEVEITILYENRSPVGPYCLEVPARRLRRIRFNDLIDPQALPLDTPYAALVEANVPIVVQFTRMDTADARHALLGTMGFSGP